MGFKGSQFERGIILWVSATERAMALGLRSVKPLKRRDRPSNLGTV